MEVRQVALVTHRLRSDEPHRRADGRWHDLFYSFNAGRDSGDLCAGETVAVGAGAGGVILIRHCERSVAVHAFWTHGKRSAAIHAVESSKENGVGSLAAQRTCALTLVFVLTE